MTTPRLLFVLAAVLALAACGDEDDEPGFEGRFRGKTIQDVPFEVELHVSDSGALTGTSRSAIFEARLEGQVDGNHATGTSRAVGVPMEATFEATLDGDTITWKIEMPIVAGARQTSTITIETTRVAEGEEGASAGGARIDPQLVGRWRRTVTSSFRAGDRGVSQTTDIYCELRADGTFTYGGASGAFTGTGRLDASGGTTGAGATRTGEWMAMDRILRSRIDGTTDWTVVGRYSVSSSGLVVYPAAGGDPEYWERQ